jgi:sugar (pentulose or hexulose) kinase
MGYLIGVDVGTSQIKAVLFDSAGNEIATASQQTKTMSPSPRYMEQDMEQVWTAAVHCLSALFQVVPKEVRKVQAVGISGQGEGLWLLDHQGQPVQPAILWNDGRSADTVADLSPQAVHAIRQITMTTPITSSTLMQLKWMHDHQPDILKKAAYCVFCKDWVRFRLTGQINSEYTDTSVTLMDMASRKLAENLFTMLDLHEHLKLFPPLLESTAVSGYITSEVSAMTGLPQGIPVAAGALDVTATGLGVHAVEVNDLFLILGTTACAGLVVSPDRADPAQGKYLLHPKSDQMIKIMATMAGTPNVDWLVNSIVKNEDFSFLEKALENTSAGSGGVLYFPYISPAGERYPFYHPYAKAGFFGLTSAITQNQLIRAVYEGVGFSVKDSLDTESTSGRIHIAGGGSKSNFWCQIIADCTGHEVIRYQGEEFGAKGAAILAGLCAGWFEQLDEMADSFCRVEQTFLPDPQNEKIYNDLYSIYKSVRLAHSDLWYAHQKIVDIHRL